MAKLPWSAPLISFDQKKRDIICGFTYVLYNAYDVLALIKKCKEYREVIN